MFTIVIPTLNTEGSLGRLLGQCADHNVVISDGGSSDGTIGAALGAGATLALGTAGRGGQLSRGVNWAFATKDADWILVIHADCQLPLGWAEVVTTHIKDHPDHAAYFAFGAGARGWRPRFMEFVVGLRCQFLRLPYGDQGLLISRDMYDAVGGYPNKPLFEDVDIIRAIKTCYGRRALRRLPARIITDVSAYTRDGFATRTWRNVKIILAYNRGEDVAELLARYRKTRS